MLPNPATKWWGRDFLTFVSVSRTKHSWCQPGAKEPTASCSVGSASGEWAEVLQPGKQPRTLLHRPRLLIWLLSRRQCPGTSYPLPSCPSCTHLFVGFLMARDCSDAHFLPAAHVGSQASFAPEDTSSNISWREELDIRRENEQFLQTPLKGGFSSFYVPPGEMQVSYYVGERNFYGLFTPFGHDPGPVSKLSHTCGKQKCYSRQHSHTRWSEMRTRLAFLVASKCRCMYPNEPVHWMGVQNKSGWQTYGIDWQGRGRAITGNKWCIGVGIRHPKYQLAMFSGKCEP